MIEERNEVQKRVKRIKSLPTLPTVAQKISKMVENEDTSATEIGGIISTDQALSAKVLRLVNSSFYGFPGRISSISNAIVLLGFNVIKGLILSASVFEMMERSMVGLWEHSLGCATAAGIIAQAIGHPDPEELSVAGLLHDIGKVVVSLQMSDEFACIQKAVMEEGKSFYAAEKGVLNFTHEDIGQWLAESWNLPVNLLEPIAYHHRPLRAKKAATQAAVIHLANFLVRAKGFGSGGDMWVPPLDHQAWKSLDLSMMQLEEVIYKFTEEVESVEAKSLFEGIGE